MTGTLAAMYRAQPSWVVSKGFKPLVLGFGDHASL
jgi:hypothetical protein